jgi:hypothetical protein
MTTGGAQVTIRDSLEAWSNRMGYDTEWVAQYAGYSVPSTNPG